MRPAERCGVRAGDTVLCVEGNSVASYDDFAMLVKALERPLVVRLRRELAPPPSPPRLAQASSSSASASASADSTVFALTDGDKEARRQAMQAAADARAGAYMCMHIYNGLRVCA